MHIAGLLNHLTQVFKVLQKKIMNTKLILSFSSSCSQCPKYK